MVADASGATGKTSTKPRSVSSSPAKPGASLANEIVTIACISPADGEPLGLDAAGDPALATEDRGRDPVERKREVGVHGAVHERGVEEVEAAPEIEGEPHAQERAGDAREVEHHGSFGATTRRETTSPRATAATISGTSAAVTCP